jgi:murein DD-endopeptidase MepM/ murein hydrolase activator NlpD
MALPIKNGKITTPFGKVGKHWSSGKHLGADFAVPIGTPVLAMVDGKVTNSTWGKAYGNQVVMAVDGGFLIYAHLNKLRCKPGQFIKKGEIVGESGNSGNSTGPHLHIELRNQARWTGGTAIDPKAILEA